MRKLFVFSILMISLQTIHAQKIDTIFYDANWKGVPVKELATYKRIFYISNGSQYQSLQKTYYISGEIEGECTPISINKYDDSKSKWKGAMTTYYKSGQKQSEQFYNETGQREGEWKYYYESGKMKELGSFVYDVLQNITDYYENGSVKDKGSFKNGKLDGIYYMYQEDGSGSDEVEMANGEPVNYYITHIDKEGNRIRYDKDTHKLIQVTPSISDIKETKINGTSVRYYQMNGIFLMANLTIEKVYGKYYTLSLKIANNSNESFIFEADKLYGSIHKGAEDIPCKVLSSEQYLKIVGRKQGWNSFFNALGENIAAHNAGISTSSAAISSAGYVNSAAGTIYGAGTTATQTANYNGAAQYQANQNAQQNTAQYNNQLDQYRQALDEGYLKSNSVDPGKSISGYINIEYKKGDKIAIYIPLNGSIYTFEWTN